jgi:hypothetical protein
MICIEGKVAQLVTVEILWHHRETRWQTANTNFALKPRDALLLAHTAVRRRVSVWGPRAVRRAGSMLDAATTGSIKDSRIRLKAGCSTDAVTVVPGRESEPVVSPQGEGLPRDKSVDGSSFFIVRSFPFPLASEAPHYDLC